MRARVAKSVGSDGRAHTDLEGILSTAQSFYERLFARVECDETSMDVLMSACLAEEDVRYCGAPLKLHQVTAAIIWVRVQRGMA